jgi:hypothetical protein
MHRVFPLRAAVVLVAGALLIAASLSTSALFVSTEPGADLEPSGAADQLISLIQGQEHILWTSTAGTVNYVTVTGWPVNDGEVELGGALSITQPDGGEGGVLDVGEKPMSVEFEFAD